LTVNVSDAEAVIALVAESVPTIVIAYDPAGWFVPVVVVADDELEDPQPDIPNPAIPSASTATSNRTPRRFRPAKPSISTPPSAIVTGTRPIGAGSCFAAVFVVAAAVRRIRRFTLPVVPPVTDAFAHDEFVYSVNVVVTAAVPVTGRSVMS